MEGGTSGPFYDGVGEVPAEIKAQWEGLGFNGAEFLKGIGLSIPAGEVGRSVFEKIRSRPTCEMNGITGGYSGRGFKTVIPSKASAKVSFRLVGDQDPQKIVATFQEFVRSRLPADCTVEFIPHGASPALRVEHDHRYLARARKALADEWSSDPALVNGGGSIPVVGEFKRTLLLVDDGKVQAFTRKSEPLDGPLSGDRCVGRAAPLPIRCH